MQGWHKFKGNQPAFLPCVQGFHLLPPPVFTLLCSLWSCLRLVSFLCLKADVLGDITLTIGRLSAPVCINVVLIPHSTGRLVDAGIYDTMHIIQPHRTSAGLLDQQHTTLRVCWRSRHQCHCFGFCSLCSSLYAGSLLMAVAGVVRRWHDWCSYNTYSTAG